MTGIAAWRVFAGRRLAQARGLCAATVLALFTLAGCGGTSVAGDDGIAVVSECVPFARVVAEIPIYGNAADWWSRAAGRYARLQTPAVGSVLVFRRTSRLPYGHVAVVSRVLSSRRVLLTHANWVPHRISEDALSIDVSPDNDWSQVRVWWPPSRRLGATTYPTFGFVRSDRPLQSEQIAANARRFVMVATRD